MGHHQRGRATALTLTIIGRKKVMAWLAFSQDYNNVNIRFEIQSYLCVTTIVDGTVPVATIAYGLVGGILLFPEEVQQRTWQPSKSTYFDSRFDSRRKNQVNSIICNKDQATAMFSWIGNLQWIQEI
mmetsp:Transcript_12791/g.20594  ORF Transcript_12791/g.20594 Transcript_12791/m.20594 type:complete len:127 (-) Transcript_12791:46-426(-)